MIHEAATIDSESEKVVMINDVARAFFEAKATREVCIEIPNEDMTEEDVKKDMVGLLLRSLYGTRDAAMNWQEEVAKEMKRWGFKRGVYNPCLYRHPERKIRTLVHGDDFVSTGNMSAAQKFREQLESRFEIKTQLLGAEGVVMRARTMITQREEAVKQEGRV